MSELTLRAHSDCGGKVHLLYDHLISTGNKASEFASKFESSDIANFLGKIHDLGKYSHDFQEKLQGKKDRVNHSTAGMIYAHDKLGPVFREAAAFIIGGHHAGLTNYNDGKRSSLTKRLLERHLLDNIPDELIPKEILFPPDAHPKNVINPADLWIRFLFSALIDADRLDTEKHFNSADFSLRACPYDNISVLTERLSTYLQTKIDNTDQNKRGQVFLERQCVLEDCKLRAQDLKGMFTLSAPTGAGKTLSSVMFALRHAENNKMDRVIYAAPFLAIIEQTTDEFREVFGGNVVEHHSNIDPAEQDDKEILASENWDAPIISTTTVQLLESLYASKPSRCRKLHNLANSVIIIDEAHTFPIRLLDPIMRVLNALVNNYGCTVLLCSATLPDYSLIGLTNAKEISSDPDRLHQALERVNIHRKCPPLSPDELASRVLQHNLVICVVDTRHDCRNIHSLIPGAYHLSTWMCGQHRADVLSEIKHKLKNKEEVRLVCTKVIQAGVDITFPVGYGPPSGIDSTSQLAGRINREWEVAKGDLYLYELKDSHPVDQHWKLAEDCLRYSDCFTLTGYRRFFEKVFYHTQNDNGWDHHDVIDRVTPNGQELNIDFRDADDNFNLIEDDTVSVAVAYKDGATLLENLSEEKLDRHVIRKLQRYTVDLNKHQIKDLKAAGAIRAVTDNLYAQVNDIYDPAVGINLEG